MDSTNYINENPLAFHAVEDKTTKNRIKKRKKINCNESVTLSFYTKSL